MLKESDFVKIRVYVPVTHADDVRACLGRAGAGKQGNYEYCSSSYPVIGRFMPMPGARPTIGDVGTMEEVPEEMIETLCHKDLLEKVIADVKRVHPYESPMIDIIARFEIE